MAKPINRRVRAARPREKGPRARLWPLALWILAAVVTSLYAAGWRTDNRLDKWVGQLGQDAGYRVLRHSFGSDEFVLVRGDRFAPDSGRTADFARALGPRLAALGGVEDLLDPLRLPGAAAASAAGAPLPLERLAARPLARALDLSQLEPPRLDWIVQVDPAASPESRAALQRSLTQLTSEAQAAGLRLRAAGHPLVAAALDAEAKRVERVFAPWLAVLSAIGVTLFLRSFTLAGLALLPAVLAASGSRSALRLLGIESDLILVSVGPLAFVLSLTAALHLLSAYRRARMAGQSPARAAVLAREEKLAAGLLAGATTALGFGVFAFSALRSVALLGLAVSATLVVVVPLIFLALPTLLAELDPGRPISGSNAREARIERRYRRLAAHARRLRPGVLALALVLLGCGALASTRLARETNALHYFPSEHPVRATFAALEREGAGLSTLEVLLAHEPGQAWRLEPSAPALAELARELRALPHVGGLFAPESILEDLRQTLGPAGLALATAALERAGRLDVRGEWLRLSLRISNGDEQHVRSIVRSVEERVGAFVLREGLRFHVTGSLPLMLAMQRELIGTLVSSLTLTLLATGLILAWVARGRRALAAALLANLSPVAASLAGAWLLGVALDGATVMVAAVVLGLAVDNSFHLLHTAAAAGGAHADWPEARTILFAFGRVGEAALVSTVALALGFLSLAASGFAPTARFGALCSIGSVAALAGDLILLPSLWIPGRGREDI